MASFTLSPPGAIGLPAEDAVVLLRFDEETTATHPKDAGGVLNDLWIDATLSPPPVVDGTTGRARSFSPTGATGLIAVDTTSGSSLLTRDMTIQVILSLDVVGQNTAGTTGTIVARGRGTSSAEYLAYALEVQVVDVTTSLCSVRWLWQDISGNLKTQTGAQFTLAKDFTILTACRRWVSPTSVVLSYYAGDILIGRVASADGSIGGGTTGAFQVGARFSGGTYGSLLAGVIDELLILDHEITREEIEATWLRITRYQPLGVQLFIEQHDLGFPLPDDPSSDVQLDIRMTGQALGYAAAAMENIRANALPPRAYGTVLEQWEETVRVTPAPLQDIDTRRERVVSKMQQRQGSSTAGLMNALEHVIGGADPSQLQFLAYDNTVTDDFTAIDPLRWDILPNGGGIISAAGGAASFRPGPGSYTMNGVAWPPTWISMRQPVGGDGKQARQLAKLTLTTPQPNVEAGVFFQNAITDDYLLLGLREVPGGSFRVETESFIKRVSQGVVLQAIIGANPAAIWLHLFQTTTNGTWQAAWSTTSATAGYALSGPITHPTVAYWGGCYLRSVAAIGAAVADFGSHILRAPFGHRPTNAYVYLDPALGFTPDIDGAHSVIQTVKHAFVNATFVTSPNLLCGQAPGCGRGPMGGGL